MSETLVETVEYRGVTVEIHYEMYDSQNPLTEFDGQPKLVMREGTRYNLGQDEDWCRIVNTARDEIAEKVWRWSKLGYSERPTREQGIAMARRGEEMFLRYLRAFRDVNTILPMGMGDHSGIWVYLGKQPDPMDPGGWDSGHAGYLLVTNAMLDEWGCDRDKGEEAIRGSFEVFRAYVAHEVYGYVIDDGDVEGSCWGFYGNDVWDEACGDRPMGHMRFEFQAVIDNALDQRHAARVALFKQLVSA